MNTDVLIYSKEKRNKNKKTILNKIKSKYHYINSNFHNIYRIDIYIKKY